MPVSVSIFHTINRKKDSIAYLDDNNQGKTVGNDTPTRKEDRLLAKLYETTQVESDKVMCVERHIENKHGRAPLMDKAQEACEYGRERGNATTCGGCPYGVKLVEPKPAHDSNEVLRHLKEEQRKNKSYIG